MNNPNILTFKHKGKIWTFNNITKMIKSKFDLSHHIDFADKELQEIVKTLIK